ncbi:FUSC family protein [Dactylosporangium sp. AC04546]|uniref:FUSC family protein n=1 Tax=Dactylosporangium sp. AC04546 TaxID=2862460 RepID=UPI001EDFD9EA|nr:FUSC family protein [Dactylosporangium sp. AC04546]WVK88633.1 FUSC family protein [Dactylosporangium sp. AC04546]
MAAPIPPAPPPSRAGLAALLAVRPVPRRWPVAIRAAVCMGLPALAGWLAGDIAAGLTATIGGFTALYGSGRPYRYRAGLLAAVAVAITLAVLMGLWTAGVPWLAVVALTALAAGATLLCNAVPVGQPGAYFVVLAAATGVAMHAGHPDPWRVGMLVLAGGAVAWLVHLAGAVVSPRGPERSAVAAAGAAVASLAEAGPDEFDDARHRAAAALHESWNVLVAEQPARASVALDRLRTETRALHLRFADILNGPRRPERAAPETGAVELPFGRPGAGALLREALRPGSLSVLTAARAGLAALIAGSAAAGLGLEHAYWATTAAVLVLHQGFDWPRTAQRSLERLTGTWAGLLLAGGLLLARPAGLWLVLAIVALQYTIEWFVPRNYALAVVFITPVALLIGSGGRPVDDVGALLVARGIDTVIGCAVALVVFLATARLGASARLPEALAGTLDAAVAVLGHLATGAVTTTAARTARRDLQHRALTLPDVYTMAPDETLWPGVVAVQRLAYRMLATCWEHERTGGRPALTAADAGRVGDALRETAAAVRDGRPATAAPDLPPLFAGDVLAVQRSLGA